MSEIVEEIMAGDELAAQREALLGDLNQLLRLPHEKVLEIMEQRGTSVNPFRSKFQILLELCAETLREGKRLEFIGVLELGNDGNGTLRWEGNSFTPVATDVHVSGNFIRRYRLQPGLRIRGRLRGPRDREKGLGLEQIIEIEGVPITEWVEPKPFDSLTPLFPKQRLVLENSRHRSLTGRAIDLVAPLGKGQRALIVAPPRVGKTIMLKEIAKCIRAGSPEVELILLLIDERPEEVTDLRREIDASIYSSTFDENSQRHIQVGELVLERAKRLLELGKDVVVLLDSLTRLARGYNNQAGSKGRLMSGGIESKALLKPKKFFGAARNVEEGGSLTIVASALVDTGSKADELIFEEFKGTGNMEIHLDRGLVEKRVYPAIHILQSGTRKDELLYHPQEYERVTLLRKQLAQMPPMEAMEVLVRAIRLTSSNAELLLTGLRA